MNILFSLVAVLVLVLIPVVGVGAGMKYAFAVIIPYAAFAIFLVGFIGRILAWARVPVPFRIPTTGGQQESLPWIKPSPLDNPSTNTGAVGRMILEVLFFRSLFRNSKMELGPGPKVNYGSDKWLWLFAILFHYSFFVVAIRHFRLFTNPVPMPIEVLDHVDSILQITVPALYQSDLIFLGAVGLLFVRRLYIPQVRYISLIADYFPLLLIMGIGFSGFIMRYLMKTDIVAVKELTMGLVTFKTPNPIPDGIGVIFYIHLFLVCVLMAYFPFSKLMHLGGVFLSPTRNLPNNSRMVRHINPWNDPNIKPHSYEAYEDDFREKMIEAGIPVEKE